MNRRDQGSTISLTASSAAAAASEESGYGRENGPEGLDEYLQTKSVVVSAA